jgi:two-component system sensor kinase FixL
MAGRFKEHDVESQEDAAGAESDGVLLFEGEALRIRMASPAARAVLGYDASSIAALRLLDLTPDVGEAALHRLLRRMSAHRAESSGFSTRLRRRDGHAFTAHLRIHPIGPDDTLYYATIEPSPGGAEARVLDAALLNSVIDTAPDAIITIDREGHIGGFSPAAERLFGYAAAEVLGKNVSMLMPEPYRKQHDSYLKRYHDTGEKRIIGIGRTVTAQHKSGRTFPVELAVGEVKSGTTHLFTGFIRDISDRVAAQARAIKLQQELSHVGRLSAMGEIASLIVHELNQPLTAIANFGEAAKRLVEAGDSSGRVVTFIERSVAQAHRASEMIRRLRSFVSQGPAERERIAVNEVVRDAARLALIGSADQQIQAAFELADGLPEISADRIQLQQVVVNLIRNAIDAMLEAGTPEPGAARLVVATGREADGGILVSVTDTGPGIAPGIAQQLFNPFVTTKPGGMGIGLSVSRSIVEAHGGRIWVEPGPEGGSRFSFILPLDPGQS